MTHCPATANPPAAKSYRRRESRGVSPPDAKGAVEVSIAINPTNPDHMIAVSIANMKKHPGISDFAYVTNDGGRTWQVSPCPNPHKRRQGDDVIAFMPDGLAIHTFISFDGNRGDRPAKANSGIITSTSKDGVTWADQVPVVDHVNVSAPFEDKPWIKADFSKDSKHRGNLYVAWTKFDVYGSKAPEHKTHIYFSRSTNGGKSFSVPHKISEKPGNAVDDSNTVEGAVPAAGPNGDVYVVWAGPLGLVFTKSTDGGYSFGKNKVIVETPGGWDFNVKGLGRCNGMPSIGTDISQGKDRGSIYVNWGDNRHGDPDSFLIVSRDGGETWSEPRRINTDPQANGKEQFFTWMVVDPVDGAVNIVYYDRGAHQDTHTDVTLARSVDGGRTFAHYKVNDQPYDLSKLGFFGDYLGLDCYGGRVAVAWMHPIGATKQLGISSAVMDFQPGTQEAAVESSRHAPRAVSICHSIFLSPAHPV